MASSRNALLASISHGWALPVRIQKLPDCQSYNIAGYRPVNAFRARLLLRAPRNDPVSNDLERFIDRHGKDALAPAVVAALTGGVGTTSLRIAGTVISPLMDAANRIPSLLPFPAGGGTVVPLALLLSGTVIGWRRGR